MVFWCPVNGGRTSGSSYPRSELRERINPSNDSSNWTGYGTHVLSAQCKVTQVPSTPKIIIGQIHGYNSNPLIKLQYSSGKIEALVKVSPTGSTDQKYSFVTVGLNSNIDYAIKVVDGLLTMTVNGLVTNHNFFATNSGWTNVTYYFKAGSYVQDNSGNSTEGGTVMFYSLSVSHGPLINPQPRITNLTYAAGQFGFKVLDVTGSNCIIERSSDLLNWASLVTNSVTNGALGCIDPNPDAVAMRFYRARSFGSP